MQEVNKLLLASHGTPGAQAAEQIAFEKCCNNTQVTHLYVVPDFWRNMLGDDWLNNSSTREQFKNYLEAELGQEADYHIQRVRSHLQNLGVQNTHKFLFGEPQQCLINTCNESTFDLIVMGSPRPKGLSGLRSCMASKKVTRQLKTPVIQVPHPNA